MSGRAVIYTRVSSDPDQKSRSTTEQEAECRRVCEERGLEVVAVYEDNGIGASRHSKGRRIGYEDLRMRVREGDFDYLVTWEASRATRDLLEHAELMQELRDARIRLVVGDRTHDPRDPYDELWMNFNASLAVMEAEMTSKRVKRSVRARASKGKPHGKIPYGYRRLYDETTKEFLEQVIEPEEAKLIREMVDRVLGGESTNEIAADLNRRGIPTPRNGANGWVLGQVKRLCTNPSYIGKRTLNGKVLQEVDAQWPAILDEEKFREVCRILNDPRRRTNRGRGVRHLLTGLLTCGVCGGKRLQVIKNRGYPGYQCKDGFCVSRRQDPLDEYIEEIVIARLSQPDALAAWQDESDHAEAIEELARLEAERDALFAAYERGDTQMNTVLRLEPALSERLDRARAAAEPHGVPPAIRDLHDGDVRQAWASIPLEVKREVIESLMEITVNRVKQGSRFSPAGINVSWRAHT